MKIATIQDIDLLVKTRKLQLIDEGISPDSDIDTYLYDFFQETLRNGTLYQILLYDKDILISTGAVVFYNYPPTYTNPSGKIAYITNMYTDPRYRKQGYALKILNLLEEEIKRRDVHILRLGASYLGRPVYEKQGYIQDHEWMSKKL